MGLDASACARRGEPRKEVHGTTSWTDGNGVEQCEDLHHWVWEDEHHLAEWRKHPSLQGWMRDKWNEQGQPVLEHDKDSYEEGVFCIDLEVTEEDLLELREAVTGGDLPETSGFLFGDDSSEHYKETDLQFIEDALGYLKQGYAIVYGSSW